MRTEKVQYFTKREEDFVNLLINIGFKQNVAKVLVFLANTPEVHSREIERGTGLRQSEVSLAAKYLMEQGWIGCRGEPAEKKGRPRKIFRLAKPLNMIITAIGNKKKREAKTRLDLVGKIKEHIR
jgi:predicted transcriptional regulator